MEPEGHAMVPEEPEGHVTVPEELSHTRWEGYVLVLSGLDAACAELPTRERGWKLLGTHLRWVLKYRSAFWSTMSKGVGLESTGFG